MPQGKGRLTAATESLPNEIPALPALEQRWQALSAKILSVSHLLAHKGTLTSRRSGERRVWSIRFYEQQEGGSRCQRAIYIGDHPELIDRAQQLLASLRSEAQALDEVETLARAAERITRLALRHSGRSVGPRRLSTLNLPPEVGADK